MPSDMQVMNDEGTDTVNFQFDTAASSINIFEEVEPFMESVYENSKYSDMPKGTSLSNFMECDLWSCSLPTYEHLVAWACFFNARKDEDEVVLRNVDMAEMSQAEVPLDVILSVKGDLSESITFL